MIAIDSVNVFCDSMSLPSRASESSAGPTLQPIRLMEGHRSYKSGAADRNRHGLPIINSYTPMWWNGIHTWFRTKRLRD